MICSAALRIAESRSPRIPTQYFVRPHVRHAPPRHLRSWSADMPPHAKVRFDSQCVSYPLQSLEQGVKSFAHHLACAAKDFRITPQQTLQLVPVFDANHRHAYERPIFGTRGSRQKSRGRSQSGQQMAGGNVVCLGYLSPCNRKEKGS